ncbi:hypothetical protein B1H58_07255 [Pantoea alhagi]|uniref:Flagellar protein FlhE n=2 Tax=Pantoea alhagi TaxID=1891675 RepID=A0A1W6B423_9GAMM|nr:hypothetical protein B1H58_07255 [Pantoea alhagi]
MLLMAVSLPALATHGAWSAAAAGPQLNVGRQTYAAPPLRPAAPIPPEAVLRGISWRISLLSPPPARLDIKLCSVTACIALDRLAGQKAAPLPFSPGEALRFVYAVNTPGQLTPPVRIVTNQITINYHWANRSDR